MNDLQEFDKLIDNLPVTYNYKINYRTRNQVNVIRKKIEQIEFVKRDMIREHKAFTKADYINSVESLNFLDAEMKKIRDELEFINSINFGEHPCHTNLKKSIRELDKQGVVFQTTDLGGLIVEKLTPTVYLKVNGESVKIGKMRVVLQIPYSGIEITNLEKKIGDLDHPHIADSTPCLGGYGNIIRGFVKRGQLPEAFNVIDDFLHSYNERSTYVKISSWKLASNEMNYCECGDLIMDCKCGRIPVSVEVDEDDDDEYDDDEYDEDEYDEDEEFDEDV